MKRFRLAGQRENHTPDDPLGPWVERHKHGCRECAAAHTRTISEAHLRAAAASAPNDVLLTLITRLAVGESLHLDSTTITRIPDAGGDA